VGAGRDREGGILRTGDPMKNLSLITLVLLVLAVSPANSRQWKMAKVELTSETDVSSKLLGEKNTVHFTIETEDMIYFAEYTFKPGHSNSHIPDVTANTFSKIAIEGRHAYLLDATGKEVKLHISRKLSKQ
jgi:hypothetical protein